MPHRERPELFRIIEDASQRTDLRVNRPDYYGQRLGLIEETEEPCFIGIERKGAIHIYPLLETPRQTPQSTPMDWDSLRITNIANIQIDGVYRHYRSDINRYQVLGIGINLREQQQSVVYQETNYKRPLIWVRSVLGESGWLTPVEVNGIQVPRFT